MKKRYNSVQNGKWGKSCEIKGGSQEMAVMVQVDEKYQCGKNVKSKEMAVIIKVDGKNFNNNDSGEFCAGSQ